MRMRKEWGFYVRLAVGVGLLGLVVSYLDLANLAELLYSMRMEYVAGVLALTIFDRIMVDYRWKRLLCAKGFDISLGRLVKISLIGQFVGSFLPSALAPDAIRAYGLSRRMENTGESWASVVVDRYISIVPLFFLASIGLAGIMGEPVGLHGDLRWMLGALFVCVVCMGAIMFSGPMIRCAGILEDLVHRVWKRVGIRQVSEALCEYRSKKAALSGALTVSCIVQVLRIVSGYLGALAFDLDIAIEYFFVFIPIITLISMVPATVAGVGVTEGAFVYFFGQAGVSGYEAFAMCMLFRLTTVLLVLFGGLIYIVEGFGERAAYRDSGKISEDEGAGNDGTGLGASRKVVWPVERA